MDEDIVLLELNARWGCALPFGWIPITGDDIIPDTEIYYAELFDNREDEVKDILQHLYSVKVLEIGEGGTVSSKHLDDCFFHYTGLEQLYTNATYDFVLYFSHESTVTAGGKLLLKEIHSRWPAYHNQLWTGELR